MVRHELLMKIKQEEFLREAARDRLISEARRGSVRRKYSYVKALVWLGSYLCKWGNLLQERFGNTGMVTPSQPTNSCIKV